MHDIHYNASFSIAADHPALPGHFPGRPIVPGVVLLDEIAAALLCWRGARLVGLPQVKFVRPLLPGQTAELHLEDAVDGVRFRLLHDGMMIANGRAEIIAEKLA